MPDLRDFVTTKEAAEMLQFHVEHVRRLMREGDLQGEKIGSAWLVLKKSVEEYVEKNKELSKFDPRRGRV